MVRAWFLSALLLGSSALAAAPQVPQLAFTRYTLDNGLTVILAEDHRLPLVAVNLWYDVGAINEVTGRTGFAHLFEHMMFQGSAHVPDDVHIGLLEKLGATDLNGTTSFDRTNYFQTVPANHLETALWLESDRMGFLLDALTQAKLDTQRDVVKNERRQSYEMRPYGLARERLMQTLFPSPHPYFGNIIGSMEDLSAAKLDDVKAFFRTYYSPANATLAIVGDFDAAKAREWVTKYFATLPSLPKPPPPKVPEVKLDREVRVKLDEPIANLPALMVAWHSPPVFKPGDAALEVLGRILSEGSSSRLMRVLVRDRQIAQSVTASQDSLRAASIFRINAIAQPGFTTDALLREVDSVLEGVRTKGVTEAELTQAKRRIVTEKLAGLQQVGGFGGKSDLLQRYNQLLGHPDGLAEDLQRFEALTPADIQAAAKQYLRPDARVVLEAVPPRRASLTPRRGALGQKEVRR